MKKISAIGLRVPPSASVAKTIRDRSSTLHPRKNASRKRLRTIRSRGSCAMIAAPTSPAPNSEAITALWGRSQVTTT